MKKGLAAKFTQNSDLNQYLKQTGNKVLKEANCMDYYWGAGLSLQDKDIIRSKWLTFCKFDLD